MQGRDDELATLADRWARARAGQGGVALMAGEPGIGKSRLIWALQQHVAQTPDAFLIQLFPLAIESFAGYPLLLANLGFQQVQVAGAVIQRLPLLG